MMVLRFEAAEDSESDPPKDKSKRDNQMFLLMNVDDDDNHEHLGARDDAALSSVMHVR